MRGRNHGHRHSAVDILPSTFNMTIFARFFPEMWAPYQLGDNYGELIESLHRLADAELNLAIVPSGQ
jgi:hypothetical protein